jgi:hypothetical protein
MERCWKYYLVSLVLALEEKEALHVHWIFHHWFVVAVMMMMILPLLVDWGGGRGGRRLSQIDGSGTGTHVAELLVYSSPVLPPLHAIHFL